MSIEPHKSMIQLEKLPRLASTIYRCQTCTKAFVTDELLQTHIKSHAETTTVTNSILKLENSSVASAPVESKDNKLVRYFKLQLD